MAWPRATLTSEGFNEFKSPTQNLKGKTPWKVDETLDWTDNWKDYTGEVYDYEKDEPDDSIEWGSGLVTLAALSGRHLGLDAIFGRDDDDGASHAEKSGLSYWGIKNNPVFEHAAKVKGIDWDSFINTYSDALTYQNARDESIERWNKETLRHRGAVKEVTLHGRVKGGGSVTSYKPYMTAAPHSEVFGLDERVAGSAELMTQMYNMNKFIYDSVKDWEEEYDAPIIEEGPTDAQYGLPKGTDPWEFYGLNKLPRILPKALDVDYAFNLNDAKASGATYRTPKGYPAIDLDSVETAEIGDAFWEYKEDFDFAQEHGYWDYDLGNTGDANYQKELQFIFGDTAGDVRIFGQVDYDALIEQGLDKDGVRDIINARIAGGQKLILGPAMAKHFDMYSYDATWWGQPSGTLGQKGVKLLQLQGLDEAGIMNRYAKGKHGSQIGQWVRDNFGVRIWPETGMYDYFFMDPGGKKAFGMQDYYQLEGQGMEVSRIKQIAKELTSAGWILGPEAAKTLGLGDYQPQYQTAMNDGHLGGQVVDDLITQGQSIEEIQAYGENPEVKTIGSEAAEELYGWTDKGEINAFGMKDIHENWGPGEEPSGVILAKIAAGNSSAIGGDAVDYIWGNALRDIHMKPPVGADPSHLTFGMDAINYLRTNHPAASTNKMLKAIAKGAHWVGEAAAKELGIPANKPPIEKKTLQQVLSTPMSEYDKPDLISRELGGFGQQEIDWMTAAEWTPAQMRAVTENFDSIGPAAAEYLWGGQLTGYMQAPANAVDPNALTFGMNTIKYLDRVDPQINDESLAAIARGAAHYVGEGALEYFRERDIDVGKGSAPLNAPRPRPAPTPLAPARPKWVDQGVQGGFGNEDMNWLSSKGYSEDEMRNIASGTNKIGAEAARKLWSFTDPGDQGWFGEKDYNQLRTAGASDDVMRKIIRGMNLKTGGNYKWLS